MRRLLHFRFCFLLLYADRFLHFPVCKLAVTKKIVRWTTAFWLSLENSLEVARRCCGSYQIIAYCGPRQCLDPQDGFIWSILRSYSWRQHTYKRCDLPNHRGLVVFTAHLGNYLIFLTLKQAPRVKVSDWTYWSTSLRIQVGCQLSRLFRPGLLLSWIVQFSRCRILILAVLVDLAVWIEVREFSCNCFSSLCQFELRG